MPYTPNHSGMEFLASTLSYSTPQPVQPQDEAAELQRKFIEATDALAKMADRIQALQRVRAVA